MTAHFNPNFSLWHFQTCICAYRCVSRNTVDGFITSARWQRCLHSVRPSAVERQHFLLVATFTQLSPEIILKEVCQPTEVTQLDWRECEPMGDFMNIKFDRFVQWGPARWGEGFGLAECLCGWLSFQLPSVPRTRRDDVTGSQSKVSPGASRKKTRCLHVLLVNS